MEIKSRISFRIFVVYSFLFLLIINPVFNFDLPLLLRAPDIILSFLIVFFLSIKNNYKISKDIFFVLFFNFTLIVYCLFLEFFYNLQNLEFIISLVRASLTIMAAFYIYINYIDKINLETIIISLCLLQGFVLFFSFINNDFRDFLSIFFYRLSTPGLEHLTLLRVPGFVETGGDGLSMNHCILSLTSLMFSKRKDNNLLVILSFVSGLTSVFTGRSGFVVFILLGLFILICFKGKRFRLNRLFLLFFMFVLIVLIVYLFRYDIGYFAISILGIYGYEYPLVRILKMFISLVQTGKFRIDIIENLFGEHLNFPTSLYVMFFGNNSMARAIDYMIKVDIGFLRLIHTIGIVGLLVYIQKYVYLLLKSKSILIFLIILTALIFNIKIFYTESRSFIFLLTLIYLYEKNLNTRTSNIG